MQRRGIAGLLFVLALAVQVLLPGVSASAYAQSDPAGAANELCWKAASSFASQRDHGSGQPERRHDGCLFCQASSSGATPFVATPTAAAFVSTSYQLRRFAADAVLPRSFDESARRARAPPQIS